MRGTINTVSKEAHLPIPPTYSIGTSSRSTMDRCFYDYIPHGWSLGPSSEDVRILCENVIQIDRALASHAAALTVARLPVHTALRSTKDYDFNVSVSRCLDRTFLTGLYKIRTVTTHLTDPMTPTPELQPRETGADTEFNRSLGRLNYLRTLTNGWLGEGSFGASTETGREAEDFLKRLRREAPTAPLPVLGLDTDGTIVMSWSGNGLTGSMTIYGDGSYSYFVRRDGTTARDSEAQINRPIREPLKRLLEA